MTSVVVHLGAGKRQLVKTSPTTILREVVNTVCSTQNYPSPETYGLKSGKNFLDLSLSIRYANIAAGTKLELAKVPKDKSAPTHVNLALQLEDGGRRIQSFAITTTLWDVLLGFERTSDGSLNLTRRTATPQSASKNIFSLQRLKRTKPAAEVYLLPIVILLEREYVSIKTLKTTTLQLAGLLKGNSVFRVIMRFTDAGIEDFMEEIEQDYLPPAETNNTAEPAPEQALPSSSSSTLPEPALTATLSLASSITVPTHSPLVQEASSSFVTTSMDQSEADSADNNKDVSCSSEPSRPELTHTEDMDITPQETHSVDTDMTLQETQAMDVGTTPQESQAMDVGMTSQESQAMDVGMTPQETQTMDMGITLQKTPTMDMTPHAPEMTSRPGVPRNNTRDVIAPPQGSNKETEFQRQSPLQDVSAAMIEASQEIRQLREQQTQAALTDRVKRLSKSSDRSDRERFERGLLRGTLTEEPISEIDMDSPQPQPDPPSTSVPNQQDVVRQIAHRVSMQWKEAQQRGDSITDYYALIAEEIKKEQRAGSLPIASTTMNRPEQDASARPAATPEPLKSSTVVEETVDRNVKVFKPPTDEATPLSNQIDLPDDFYTLTAQDLAKVMDGQKAKREEEENRGFKTAAMRAEEEKAKERRYPKSIIRIRFPDRVQIQGTFRSQETIGDLRNWVASVCVGQGEKFDLYITPPRKVLSDDGQTLYQAGLAPKSIVYFSWRDSKLNQNSPFLNGKYVMMMEDLPAPGTDPEASEPESSSPSKSPSDTTLSLTESLPMTKEDKRTSQRTDRPGTTTTVLPKWMKLSKK